MTHRQEKILGGFLGAALGDAMGAVTEIRANSMIQKDFGGWVTDLIDAPTDGLVYNEGLAYGGFKVGQVTDDFSASYYAAMAFADCGKVTKEAAAKALLDWSEDVRYNQAAGPTTRVALAKLRGEQPQGSGLKLRCENRKASNGAPMKVGCVGLFNAGNPDKAVDDAITMCSVTHNNPIALSGAAAIAAATAEAMKEGVSYLEVIQAGVYGAVEGYKRALPTANPVAGASVEKRMYRAVDLGLKYQGDWEKAMLAINELIGGGLPANEAVPAAFGYIAATKGDVMQTIWSAVNAGDDTDTVACMAGYVTGALCGVDKIPQKYLTLIEEANQFPLTELALRVDALL